MRALFIIITDLPGGAERVSYGIASELASRPGWQVDVLIVCSKASDSFSMQALAPQVRVHYGRIKSWFRAFPLMPFRLAFRRYDLVFTTHIYTNALVSAMRRLRLVRIGKLVMRESMTLFDRYTGPKRWLFSGLYRCYGSEDLLIAQTSYMVDHVAGRLSTQSLDHLKALPNPVDVDAIRKASAEALEPELHARLDGRSNILFCGRFVDFKRPGVALEVFQLLAEENNSLQLVFMGTGPLEEQVRTDASQLKMSDRIIFLGQRSNPYPVMAACQYGLLPSQNEGFPNVALEMMASGMRKIVVTPCAGDLDSLAGVTISKSMEAADLAAALRDAIRCGEDRSHLYKTVAAARSPRAYVDSLLYFPAGGLRENRGSRNPHAPTIGDAASVE